MLTIKDFEGTEWQLSDDIYEITDNDHPSHDMGYGKGDRVRIIDYPSYSDTHLVTCRVEAEIAEFCGIKKTSLRKVA